MIQPILIRDDKGLYFRRSESLYRTAALGDSFIVLPYGLHCCQVLGVGLHGGTAGRVPHKQLVVIPTTRQVLVVRGPLQPNYLSGEVQPD